MNFKAAAKATGIIGGAIGFVILLALGFEYYPTATAILFGTGAVVLIWLGLYEGLNCEDGRN